MTRDYKIAKSRLLCAAIELSKWNLGRETWCEDSPGAAALKEFETAVKGYKRQLRRTDTLKCIRFTTSVKRLEYPID